MRKIFLKGSVHFWKARTTFTSLNFSLLSQYYVTEILHYKNTSDPHSIQKNTMIYGELQKIPLFIFHKKSTLNNQQGMGTGWGRILKTLADYGTWCGTSPQKSWNTTLIFTSTVANNVVFGVLRYSSLKHFSDNVTEVFLQRTVSNLMKI